MEKRLAVSSLEPHVIGREHGHTKHIVAWSFVDLRDNASAIRLSVFGDLLCGACLQY